MSKEKALVARGAGKWGLDDFPKTGWECVGTTDLGSAVATCEMCEYMAIRYVQHMQHPSGLELKAGCECAGHMTGDLVAAQGRDKAMRNAASRHRNRQRSLEKDKRRLEPLRNNPSAIRQIQSIHRRAMIRASEATAEYEKHPSTPHFDMELEAGMFALEAEAAVEAVKQQQPPYRLRKELLASHWTPTPKGQRLETSQGDMVQAFQRADGSFSFGYQLRRRKMVWSAKEFPTLEQAMSKGRMYLILDLRRAGRLPELPKL
ncbi:hypothetical protein FY036_15820 [Mesorhizobium microcysteis]|uniref:Uncharacterized protein n=1 Tax=Neoaquamicrobium microcysteis TaxID=2682781 RepID=A0A5D4GRF9_9HYPH|nr:hypothetical protein [Mesorhizobium microcysteis]TYR30918.1 hypothetical protein FY036_15820 [Mesorhizobium microcysteis]